MVQGDHQVAVGDRVDHQLILDHQVAEEAEEVLVSGGHREDQVEHPEAEAAEEGQVDQPYLEEAEAAVGLPFRADQVVAEVGNPGLDLEQRHLP